MLEPGRVAQSVGHLTRKSGVLGSIPGRATYFRFSFRFFKKGSCQLLAKVCARIETMSLHEMGPQLILPINEGVYAIAMQHIFSTNSCDLKYQSTCKF